jgi:hypothetical protein
MTFDEDDNAVLSTGKTLYTNMGIIGLGPDLEVSEGCDGTPHAMNGDEITAAEWVEVADHMIAQWKAFRAKHAP